MNINNEPTIANLSDSTSKLSKYLAFMLENPTPSEQDIAGENDINNVEKQIKNSFKKIKLNTENMPLPYKHFKKDYPEKKYPTKGKHSSSYFVKIGTCKSNKIKTREKCESQGLKWVPNNPLFDLNIKKFYSTKNKKKHARKLPKGNCFKPKFMYIDNSSKGLLNLNGMGPSIYNDIIDITPDKLFSVLAGFSKPKGIIDCKENFLNYSNNTKYIEYIFYFIMTIVILFIIYFNKNK